MTVTATRHGAVLITGSSTGIGRASALALDQLGFTVYAGVRKAADGEELTAAASKRLKPLILDVTDAGQIAAAAERVAAENDGRLAGLVNNAGIAVAGPIEVVTTEQWRQQLEVNVIGQAAVTRALLPMIRAAKGRIVLISSVGGRTALPMLAPYGASKHALEAIGDSLRGEMRRFGVEVAIIEPGAVATPIWEKSADDGNVARDQMSEGDLATYGEALDRLEALAIKTGAAGVPAEKVADAVVHALTAKRPRTRYVIGREAKIQLAAHATLSDRLWDRFIARVAGI